MFKVFLKIKLVRQHDQMDCGPASLCMITDFYGNKFSLNSLRQLSEIGKDGVSMLNIINAAKKIGFETLSVKLGLQQLIMKVDNSPCILFWNKNHFLVLEKITVKRNKKKFYIVDPAHGKITLDETKFKKFWFTKEDSGVALFLNPTEKFHTQDNQSDIKDRYKKISSLLTPHKSKIALLMGFVFLGSLLNIALPFLTEALIDNGVNKKDLNYIALILASQLFVFFGVLVVSALRNWYTLLIGNRFSIDIIYSYLDKVLKLPLSFFDSKNSGDFNQRIQDNIKIEEFFTSDSILTIFSIISLFIFSIILWYYDFSLFLIYIGLTGLSIAWSVFWLKKRETIDYQLFRARAENQEAVYEFYNGIREMKLNQFEEYKKNEWITLQNRLFSINIKSLKIEQFQSIGFTFFNQLKNILITFLAANYVVKGNMSLGALLSVSYIIGQMNSPIQQLLVFFRSQQDAFLSFDRLSEVYTQKEEEDGVTETLHTNMPPVDILLKNLNFKYNSSSKTNILENINITIPEGKVTAIVGHSGSGKTTLMKLLLRFFSPSSGSLSFGATNAVDISPESIRKNSGVVMQDGYIFSDTIARNIATNDETIDQEKLYLALKTVNLLDYVNSLALKELTKIGAAGNDISGGQKQRILIARAIYKNPKYLFLDEATSALDATNEKQIQDNLQLFFKNKTVVIIAHRLSTVQNADQIIVLSKGSVVEQGNHQSLIKQKGAYYTLVKNQLNI